MKKTLTIALAGMMMFAFTQCGETKDSKDQSQENQQNTEAQSSDKEEAKDAVVITGSLEYQDAVKGINEMKDALLKGKDCDQISLALDKIEKKYTKEYDEKDKMTDDERTKLVDLYMEFVDLTEKVGKELGCE